MIDINQAIQDVAKGLDNLFTSDDERAKAQEKILKLKLQMYQIEMDMREREQELQKELMKRNMQLAKKSWIGRWPEMLAVVGCIALFVDLILRPILSAYGIHFIDIDESKIIGMLFKLIGLK